MSVLGRRGALTFKFLLGILILAAIIYGSLAFAQQKNLFEDRPFTATQTAIQRAALEGEKARIYLELAADIAAEQTKEDVAKHGACEPDYEEQTFPCGTYLGACKWTDGDQSCIPDHEETIRSFFAANLFTHLQRHPLYAYPPIKSSLTFNQQDITVTAASQEDLSLTFAAGGKNGFVLAPKTKYLPDHEQARAGQQLNFLLRGGNQVKELVVHYTAGNTVNGAVDALSTSGKSYHYIIDKDGSIHQYVPEDKSAQHAGCSPNSPECVLPHKNSPTIGISFVNCGWDTACMRQPSSCVHEQFKGVDRCWEPYTQEQYDAFVTLMADVISRHEGLRQAWRVDPNKALMHSDIKSTKQDPGPLFEQEWPQLQQRINDLLATPQGHPQAHVEELPSTLHVKHDDPKNGPEHHPNEYQLSDGQLATATTPLDPANPERTLVMLAEEAGDRYAIKPALLLALMHVESTYGSADACAPTKSSLTGCAWYDSCAHGCGCPGQATATDESQLRCAAATLRTAYEEATTGNTYIGAYTHCKGQQDPWPCILAAYGPQPAQGKTTNYAQAVIDAYDAWSDYLAGKDLEDLRRRLDGGYEATYDLPLSITATIEVSVEDYAEIEQTIKAIHQDCKDNYTCFLKKIEEHNQQHPDNKLTTEGCTDNPITEELLSKTLACEQFPDDTPCTFTIQATTPPPNTKKFTLFFDQQGIDEIREPQTPEPLRLIPKKDLTNVYTDKNGEQQYDVTKYVFNDDNPPKVGFDKVKPNAINLPSMIFKEPLPDYDFAYIKKQGVTHIYDEFTPAQDGGYFIPVRKDYLVCNKTTNLSLALTIDDPAPPAVTGIDWRDNRTYHRYDLEWAPVTTYPDGTPVNDVQGYAIYCSNNPLPKDRLPMKYLSLVIMRKDGNPFPAQDYANVQAMTAPLETCEGAPVGDNPVHVAIIPIDTRGQLNFTYQEVQLTRLPLVATPK
ncbi:N-acetylmuramoyl-L-alanine amidase, partial [Candidatus Woesearchaeota archaeon]|nr:N-acetylmuramoyl-L-alanine amidase [Candidatus Woesearchaeota archaeon]